MFDVDVGNVACGLTPTKRWICIIEVTGFTGEPLALATLSGAATYKNVYWPSAAQSAANFSRSQIPVNTTPRFVTKVWENQCHAVFGVGGDLVGNGVSDKVGDLHVLEPLDEFGAVDQAWR